MVLKFFVQFVFNLSTRVEMFDPLNQPVFVSKPSPEIHASVNQKTVAGSIENCGAKVG